jgi:hypothetical protein
MPLRKVTCEKEHEDEVGEKKKGGRDDKMRNKGRAAAGRQNVLNKYDHHSSLTLCRTCDARAQGEVHALHAHGEHDLVDST